MTTESIAAILLIGVPIAFNATFTLLARSFSYPDILREPAGAILTRFSAGGTSLLLQWWAFALTALLMVPVVVLVASLFADSALRSLALAAGLLSALVQTLGLMRWPFVVPVLARRYLDVGIGEHLGYLFTGSWTILTGALIVGSAVAPVWLGWLAFPIGTAILLGALEFVGPNEREGWSVAARVTPIAYIAWSLWLLAFGVGVLLT